jgi:hypothetical protein
MDNEISVELDGSTYIWNGSQWRDQSFLKPVASIQTKLNGK